MNYSTHEAAAMAVQHLNGIEFPPQSSHRLKVMFAEPLGAKSPHAQRSTMHSAAFASPYGSPDMDVCATQLEERLMDDPDSSGGFGINDSSPEDKVPFQPVFFRFW